MSNTNDKQLSMNLTSLHICSNKTDVVTSKEEVVAADNIFSISSKIDEVKTILQTKLNARLIDRSNHFA